MSTIVWRFYIHVDNGIHTVVVAMAHLFVVSVHFSCVV